MSEPSHDADAAQMRTAPSRARVAVVATALAAGAIALRAPFLTGYHEDIDSLRFALAVERFDPASLRPHAPFYPVYVAAAKLVAALGASPVHALGVVGLLACAIAVVATAAIAREALGDRIGLVAGALMLASPFAGLSALKATSDAAGLAIVLAALVPFARARTVEGRDPGAARRLRTVGLVLFGLSLGVRLSNFPFAFVALALAARREGTLRGALARVGDFTVGCVLWLVPLVVASDPRALVAVTRAQALGHFTRFGGSVLTVSSPLERAHGVAVGLWAHVLGGAFPGAPPLRWIALPALAALALAAAWPRAEVRRALARVAPELVAGSCAFFAWVALGQNVVYKPRHLLPLLPLLVIALAAGADRLARRTRIAWGAVALLSATWLVDGVLLARAHVAPSPAAAIALELARAPDDPTPIVTRDLGRFIATAAPARAITTVRDDDELVAALRRAPTSLVTSEVLGPTTRDRLAREGFDVGVAFARPRSPYVDTLFCDLALLRVSPAR